MSLVLGLRPSHSDALREAGAERCRQLVPTCDAPARCQRAHGHAADHKVVCAGKPCKRGGKHYQSAKAEATP